MSETGRKYRLVAVVAMAANRVIGRDGGLPWHLPEDLKFFKGLTSGHPIVLGRNTFDSIGKALPNRRNIILSRTLKTAPQGCELIQSVEQLGPDGLDLEGTVFVIGGAQVYAALMPQIDEIILSYVVETYPGDTLFPAFEDQFELVEILHRNPEFEVRRYVATRGSEGNAAPGD